jgi:hypothetical protein
MVMTKRDGMLMDAECRGEDPHSPLLGHHRTFPYSHFPSDLYIDRAESCTAAIANHPSAANDPTDSNAAPARKSYATSGHNQHKRDESGDMHVKSELISASLRRRVHIRCILLAYHKSAKCVGCRRANAYARRQKSVRDYTIVCGDICGHFNPSNLPCRETFVILL